MKRLCPKDPRYKFDNPTKSSLVKQYGSLGCDTAVSLTFKRPMSRLSAKKAIRYYLDLVDCAIYGPRAKRHKQHVTRLCFVEGKDYEEIGHRVHYHMSVKTPDGKNPEEFRVLLDKQWSRLKSEAGEATFKPIFDEPGWVGYMAKDVTASFIDNFDLDNTFIDN